MRPYIPSPVIATLTRISIAREKIGEKIYQELNLKYSLNPEEVLPQIKVPTLVLWGDQDKVINVSSTEVFKRLIPQAQVVIFKGVSVMRRKLNAPKKLHKPMRHF
jgi:abhydrolase domain-containing protein 6